MCRETGVFTVETTQILLTIEFTVLGGALISLFLKSRAKRKSRFGTPASTRLSRNLPQELAQKRPRKSVDSHGQTAASEASPGEGSTGDDTGLECPIPWGWPHYQDYRATRMERPTASQAMNSFVDCLVREKNLVAAKSSDPRINTILNALLEERRVPVSAQRPSLAEVQKRVRGEALISQ